MRPGALACCWLPELHVRAMATLMGLRHVMLKGELPVIQRLDVR